MDIGTLTEGTYVRLDKNRGNSIGIVSGITTGENPTLTVVHYGNIQEVPSYKKDTTTIPLTDFKAKGQVITPFQFVATLNLTSRTFEEPNFKLAQAMRHALRDRVASLVNEVLNLGEHDGKELLKEKDRGTGSGVYVVQGVYRVGTIIYEAVSMHPRLEEKTLAIILHETHALHTGKRLGRIEPIIDGDPIHHFDVYEMPKGTNIPTLDFRFMELS
ncbi:MAG TPA: hypothetical protein VJB87_01435 [Candidatus Nanoarchaeia archaeon]|nr:hypothetical protein [Candidatus Nanoarchaeia archaeon]